MIHVLWERRKCSHGRARHTYSLLFAAYITIKLKSTFKIWCLQHHRGPHTCLSRDHLLKQTQRSHHIIESKVKHPPVNTQHQLCCSLAGYVDLKSCQVKFTFLKPEQQNWNRTHEQKSKKRCVWCLYWSILTAYWHFQVVLEFQVMVYEMKTEKRGWICQSEHTCKSKRGTTQHLQGDCQDKLRPWTEQQRASLLQEQACLSPHCILGLGSAAVSRGRGGWVWQRSVCVCECTCTRAQLTQSETCCMATVHKGTRLCIRMCQVCL